MQALLDFEQVFLQHHQLLIHRRAKMGIIGEHPANAGTLSGGERIEIAANLRVEETILHLDEASAYPSQSRLRLPLKLDEYATHHLYPRRYLSTASAALRPSAMAHTTRDCPRRASPAAKTPCIEVW